MENIGVASQNQKEKKKKNKTKKQTKQNMKTELLMSISKANNVCHLCVLFTSSYV